jgi:hypothetical protein
VHVTSCAVIYTTVGIAARTVLRARPSAGNGPHFRTAMVLIGALLLCEQVLR